MNSKCLTEALEQKMLFQWATYNQSVMPELGLMFHIPNGGSRNKIEAHNLKLQGVKSGVPDICLPVPRSGYHGLYIELKRCQGGRVSDDQKGWISALRGQGYAAVVAKGFDEAVKVIKTYIAGGKVF